jgi:hypothetical protein
MSIDFQRIKQVARESLMADFFAVRIEEEELWTSFQALITSIKTQTPIAYITKIKQFAKESPTPTAFIEKIKSENLWVKLKELLSKIPTKK